MRWEVCEGKEHRVAARAELAIALGISNDLGVKWGLPKRRMLCSILLQPCIFFALPISCPAVQDTAWSHVNKEKITSYMIRELKENLFLLRVSQWLWQWFANIGLWPQVNFFFFPPRFWVQSRAWQGFVSAKMHGSNWRLLEFGAEWGHNRMEFGKAALQG